MTLTRHNQSKFKVEDKVYISTSTGRSLRGPFLIASVVRDREYTLADVDGNAVDSGQVYAEDALQFAN